MSVFLALVRRELGVAFNSLTGYVVVAATLLLTGFSLVDICTKLANMPDDKPITETFYQSAYFWVILLVVSPVITMRTFAAEKSSGTYEALMTTPVGDTQVVLAKFTGALLFYGLTWLPLLAVLAVLRQVTGQAAFLDLSPAAYDEIKHKILDNWDEIRAIAAQVPAPETSAELLRTVGGPTTVTGLGLSAQEQALAAANGHYLRDRFTARKLAEVLGLSV